MTELSASSCNCLTKKIIIDNKYTDMDSNWKKVHKRRKNYY